MAPFLPYPVDDPEASCIHCGRVTGVVQHDGPVPVCVKCIEVLGKLANDPHDVDDMVLSAANEQHGDVVQLKRTSSYHGRPSRLAWDWIGWT